MSGFITSALEILKDEKKSLHSKEITKLALEKGILETDGRTPDQTMNSLLLTDIKKRGESSNFIQTGPSTFGLNPNKPDIEVIDDSGIEEEEERIQIESGYTGKGGEHIVCSKLLFRGFNASIMSVDVGLDIVAIKEKEFFGIQVKTSNLNRFNTYLFDIRKASFERHSSNNIFYIFVLHSDSKDNFLIMPYNEIRRLTSENVIHEVNHGTRFRVSIKIRGGNIFLGTQDNQVNYYLNNWDIIK